MNTICRRLAVNLQQYLGRPSSLVLAGSGVNSRPVHVLSPALPILLSSASSLNRNLVLFSTLPAASSSVSYFKNERNQQRDIENRDRRPPRHSYDRFDSNRKFGGGGGRGRQAALNDKQLDEEEFGDAEPVESVGHEVSFAAASTTNGFAGYDLPKQILQRLDELGYKTPFEIQDATLKHTLAGKDVVGKAFTGSGKTLAFAIPIICRVLMSENRDKKTPKCLVLSPTRELCLQIYKSIQEIAPEVRCTPIIGGAGFAGQVNALSRGVDVVIATPGRLRDLMQRKSFIPDDIELVCLDEADEMLNPNFLDQIEDVLEASRKDKQMMMFSATLSKSVAEIADEYMKKPIFVDLTKGKSQKLPANIEHYIFRAPEKKHVSLVQQVIEKFESKRCIVFVNRKVLATSVSNSLRYSRIRSRDLHSDRSQTIRQKILDDFRDGKLNVIVATDVASRGIDIPEVDLVIQLEAPPSGVDYYIHRSGRTGRAGRVGKSVMIHSGTADVFSKELSRLVKFKKIDLSIEDAKDVHLNTDRFDRNSNYDRKPSSWSNRDRPRSSSSSSSYKPKYSSYEEDDDNDERFPRRTFNSMRQKSYGRESNEREQSSRFNKKIYDDFQI